MNKITVFDCETGPVPPIEVEQFKPEFRAPANYKNPDLIKANLAEQEAKWLADGALSAVTGQVLVIGHLDGDAPSYFMLGTEKEKLTEWWAIAADVIRSGRLLVGFCCKTFDLPFLIRRSWKLGVPVPACIYEGRYFSPAIIDVAEKWACGGREPRDRISLDTLSKFLGTGAKLGEGKDFAKLWAEDQVKALEYLRQDLTLTKAAYERLFE